MASDCDPARPGVTMRRATGGPVVAGVDVSALKAGSTDTTVHIYGDNLPTGLTTNDVDLGPGVKVTKISAQEPGMVTVTASVDAKATPGSRTVSKLCVQRWPPR